MEIGNRAVCRRGRGIVLSAGRYWAGAGTQGGIRTGNFCRNCSLLGLLVGG